MNENLPPKFENRWLIAGTLTTESELHIGDGGEAMIGDRSRPANDSESEASTVCVDYQGRAFIPGSAIKGVLRAQVFSSGTWDATWEALLGSGSPDSQDAVGGQLEFWDAFHSNGTGPNKKIDDRNRPFWNHQRRTCVAVSVSLDRRTRTAADQLLYHIEYVPADEVFAFEISGANLSDEAVARVLHLLDTFNGPSRTRATLGAQASNSWGQVTCKVSNEMRCFLASDLDAWKTNLVAGYNCCARLVKRDELRAKATPIPSRGEFLSVNITLHFPGPLLVRDPLQAVRAEKARNVAEQNATRTGIVQLPKEPNAAPHLDETGKPFIPAKAVRGVLRSRLEVILRTLNVPVPQSSEYSPITSNGVSCANALETVWKSDLAAQLFGRSGWLAAASVSKFKLNTVCAPTYLYQDFVAVDRFTGGVADKKKFDARSIVGASLEGSITVALHRLRPVDHAQTRLLLAFPLRDLAEGELCFGSGSAKGYGHCVRADIEVCDPEFNNGNSLKLNEWLSLLDSNPSHFANEPQPPPLKYNA